EPGDPRHRQRRAGRIRSGDPGPRHILQALAGCGPRSDHETLSHRPLPRAHLRKIGNQEYHRAGRELLMPAADGGAERQRLAQDARREKNWKRWGPYLSERQWGTVREDYSADGNCWDYLPHDQARSRAYRWG